jgi:hypothetical protein
MGAAIYFLKNKDTGSVKLTFYLCLVLTKENIQRKFRSLCKY